MSIPIKPEDYQSEQLTKYNKQFLIEIIHYLEQKRTVKQVVKQVKSIELKPKLNPKPVQANRISNKPYENWTNKALDSNKIQEIIRLRKEGKYLQDIADIVGTSKVSVIRYLKMNKIIARM
jgi:hypothetical protein